MMPARLQGGAGEFGEGLTVQPGLWTRPGGDASEARGEALSPGGADQRPREARLGGGAETASVARSSLN